MFTVIVILATVAGLLYALFGSDRDDTEEKVYKPEPFDNAQDDDEDVTQKASPPSKVPGVYELPVKIHYFQNKKKRKK